ncbi:uncharacterized protein F5891DRAFT_1020024 [Suillus fuscotomentosus]|uniref:Uncharacterized protein n=1 Tax=Suillus fuscotomentosus TaxID=1912939 RepID=A0AAD4EBR2_9AGAM|nr:uncharacterized protein F5891DRAFT_1020024 [Suillus fuscotomentosus]KAG1903031.1 hypothetical protein F5891DRAFT_1020024 [Suillus fuscotomentosus]
MLIQVVAYRSQFFVSVSILVRARAMLIHVVAHCSQFDQLCDTHCIEIQSKLLPVAPSLSPLVDVVQLISAVVIIFERSFYIYDERRNLQDKQRSRPSFYVALEQYILSPHAAAVRKDARNAVRAYRKAVATVPKSIAKVELVEAVLQIALNHRLPRP